MATIDFRLRPAWEAGFDGEACPEPPEWLEWHEVTDWTAAYDRGRTAAGLPVETKASPACPEHGVLLRRTEAGMECKFHPERLIKA